jgi:hypothetical protein
VPPEDEDTAGPLTDPGDTGDLRSSELPPNAAETSGIRKQRDTARNRDREARNFWLGVFGTKAGRRAMWDMHVSGDAFGERYTTCNGLPDLFLTGRHAGEQRLAFRLYRSWLEIAPEGVQLMMQENDPKIAAALKRRRRSR